MHSTCKGETCATSFPNPNSLGASWNMTNVRVMGGYIGREAVEAGCIVVDNSSEFRMDENTPLVVPEVNGHAVARHNGIIANPNCTTIIMNVPVFPLHKMAGVKRAVVSTYQAASGAGLLAMQELEQQAKDFAAGEPLTQDIFGRQYLWNLFS
eukprot:COSAG04_NODE_12819_length_633_cov_1.073034_2_plen_152_part_01